MGHPGCVTLRSMRSQNPHPNVAKSATLGWGTQCSDGSRAFMDIEGWRKKIDELDQKLVELISERARAAVAIGKLKRDTSMPIYEPDRERIVLENVQAANRGPLAGRDLVRIYERIIDVMRNVQKEEIAPKTELADAGTKLDSEVND
jgi:chorismate mutase